MHPKANKTHAEVSVGNKKRVRRETVKGFEIDGTKESDFPPLNKRKKSDITSQQ